MALTKVSENELQLPISVSAGGTGLSTLTANSVLLGNGTDDVQLVAPGTSGNILQSNGTTWQSVAPVFGIGVNQTWTDVGASRVANTTYTNTTGKPIQIFVTIAVSTQNFYLYINGSVAGRIGNNAYIDYAQFAPIIPNGSTYMITGGIVYWWELR